MSTSTLRHSENTSPDRVEDRFRAMGSDVHVVVVGGSRDSLATARERIEALESRWSRFRSDSEVTILNDRAGFPVAVSADTRLLVVRAVEAWRLTGGSFDPTLLHDLLRAGYDRSFEQLGGAGGLQPASCRNALDAPGCTDIVVDAGSVMIPYGLGFDAGGIGKGLAADLVATSLMDDGVRGACVNVGGDLRVLGDSPTGSGWTLAIEHPYADTPVALIGLEEGAIATSSVLRRVWMRDGVARHHLIDPATGEPTTSDVALAAVVTGEAWKAEVLAKAALLRGRAGAFDLIDDSSASVVVDHSGRIWSSAGLAAFLGGVELPATLQLNQRGDRP